MDSRSEQSWLLPHDPAAAGRARRLVADACGGLEPDQVDVALLLASELVGNAVRHGAGTLMLHVARDGRRVRVEVHDEGTRMPVMVEAASWTEMESGAGLRLVAALSDRWGVTAREDGRPGKHVWFELA
jgi:anti-sigma regulatory factor (Ser/Thr protein kinase)